MRRHNNRSLLVLPTLAPPVNCPLRGPCARPGHKELCEDYKISGTTGPLSSPTLTVASLRNPPHTPTPTHLRLRDTCIPACDCVHLLPNHGHLRHNVRRFGRLPPGVAAASAIIRSLPDGVFCCARRDGRGRDPRPRFRAGPGGLRSSQHWIRGVLCHRLNVPSRSPFSCPAAVSPSTRTGPIHFAVSDLRTDRACAFPLSRPCTPDTPVWLPPSSASVFIGPACPAFAPCTSLFISVFMRPPIEDCSFLKVVGRDGSLAKSIYHVSIASVSRPAVNDGLVLVLVLACLISCPLQLDLQVLVGVTTVRHGQLSPTRRRKDALPVTVTTSQFLEEMTVIEIRDRCTMRTA
ncbi:hypothetical protein LXA43DRAFT_463907 [Ganoderma leucocontextum]|nr:hypothetical protein LXA43DRAFT_463907 [Ganoderma leucocontextum]